jgi:DNA repair protein RadC
MRADVKFGLQFLMVRYVFILNGSSDRFSYLPKELLEAPITSYHLGTLIAHQHPTHLYHPSKVKGVLCQPRNHKNDVLKRC